MAIVTQPNPQKQIDWPEVQLFLVRADAETLDRVLGSISVEKRLELMHAIEWANKFDSAMMHIETQEAA